MGTGPNGENGYFLFARRATGALLFFTGAFLTVIDVVRSDFEVNVIALGLLFSFGAALYGIKAPSINWPGKNNG